jgi:hypothetical protein
LASHGNEHLFWEGGHYELNLSFDALRDKQWQRVMQAIWGHNKLRGPSEVRYFPGGRLVETSIAIPPPTATQTQHGQLNVSAGAVGCDVLATRSLFECVSILIPLGMFGGLTLPAPNPRQNNSQLAELDTILSEVALAVYDVVPFRLAAIGWERECQVIAELRSDEYARAALVNQGCFFIQDEVLRMLELPNDNYELMRPGLRWAAAKL